jgi:hypothetical protein
MGNREPKRSKLFGAPAVTGQKSDVSHALSCHPDQVAEANRESQEMGCGTPWERDGTCRITRSVKKKYQREKNLRLADQGRPRLVNFDGGHGDEI